MGGRNKNARATLRAFSAPAPIAVPDSDEETIGRRIPPSAEQVEAIEEAEAILGDVTQQLDDAAREERRVAMADDLDLPYTPTQQSDQSSEDQREQRERFSRLNLGPDEPPDKSSRSKSSSSSDSEKTRTSSTSRSPSRSRSGSRSSSPSFDPPPEFEDEEALAP